MSKRVLIVSALPYESSSSMRAFDTYLSNINKLDICQVYTNTSIPKTINCSSAYQITDSDVLSSLFKKKSCGRIVKSSFTSIPPKNKSTNFFKRFFYSFMKKGFRIVHLVRFILWKKSKWFSDDLKKWLLDFGPDLIVFHNSDSLFMHLIATKIQSFLNVPMIFEISDDYILYKIEKRFNFSIYNSLYLKSFKNLLRISSSCIYISEDMKIAYDSFFGINGNVVHICSKEMSSINNKIDQYRLIYCGNLGFGRWKTLLKISRVLERIDNRYKLFVFSPLNGNGNIKKISRRKNIIIHDPLPYEKLIKEINMSEYFLIAEPFGKKEAHKIKYSLSTKVADAISCGSYLLAFGHSDCGTIRFIERKDKNLVCNSYKNLEIFLKSHLLSANRKTFNLASHFDEFDFHLNANKFSQIIEEATNGTN